MPSNENNNLSSSTKQVDTNQNKFNTEPYVSEPLKSSDALSSSQQNLVEIEKEIAEKISIENYD